MYRERYQSIAERLLARPLSGTDGYSEEVLHRSEAALLVSAGAERRIPQALFDYYATVGRLSLNTAHNRLLTPDQWHRDEAGSVFVFMDENQSVCAWGIRAEDLAHEDPAVCQGDPDEADWQTEDCTVSEWMIISLYLQACWGGLRHACISMNPSAVMGEIHSHWSKVVDHNGLIIWEDAGLVVSEMGDPWVLAAAETDAGLRRLEGLGFELEL